MPKYGKRVGLCQFPSLHFRATFEMTGMAFHPHSLVFLPVQLQPFRTAPSADVTLEISPRGRARPRRLHATTHAHHARDTGCSHTMPARALVLPGRRSVSPTSTDDWTGQGDDRDRDEPSMIKLPVCRHSGMRSCAGLHWPDLEWSCQYLPQGVNRLSLLHDLGRV